MLFLQHVAWKLDFKSKHNEIMRGYEDPLTLAELN